MTFEPTRQPYYHGIRVSQCTYSSVEGPLGSVRSITRVTGKALSCPQPQASLRARSLPQQACPKYNNTNINTIHT